MCCELDLTSVDNKLATLCQHLINTLMDVLDGNEMPERTIFSNEIINRGTTH